MGHESIHKPPSPEEDLEKKKLATIEYLLQLKPEEAKEILDKALNSLADVDKLVAEGRDVENLFTLLNKPEEWPPGVMQAVVDLVEKK